MDGYRVPAGCGEAEFIEKRSRFIGRVWPVSDEAQALSFLKETRERHRDATHNVYAYILREGGIMRYSDDGEPQGTSGMPTLNVFRAEEIFDVCCVVTRWFGGTLLGTGGLARAYSQAAKLALESAGVALRQMWRRVELVCPYPLFERVRAECDSSGAAEGIDYGAAVTITLALPSAEAAGFAARITEITSGMVAVRELGEEYRAVRITEVPL